MIVVDTNVISELMRGEPHPAVLSWVATQPRPLLYRTYVSLAEILYGIAALPEGPTGHVWMAPALAAAADAMFAEDFAGSFCLSSAQQPGTPRSYWPGVRPASDREI